MDWAKISMFGPLARMNWTGFHTALIHVVLTQYELLIIIIINYALWAQQASHEKGDLDEMLTHYEKDNKKEPLLA